MNSALMRRHSGRWRHGSLPRVAVADRAAPAKRKKRRKHQDSNSTRLVGCIVRVVHNLT